MVLQRFAALLRFLLHSSLFAFKITDTAVKLFTHYDMLVYIIPKLLILNSLNLPVTNRNSCYLYIMLIQLLQRKFSKTCTQTLVSTSTLQVSTLVRQKFSSFQENLTQPLFSQYAIILLLLSFPKYTCFLQSSLMFALQINAVYSPINISNLVIAPKVHFTDLCSSEHKVLSIFKRLNL